MLVLTTSHFVEGFFGSILVVFSFQLYFLSILFRKTILIGIDTAVYTFFDGRANDIVFFL
jgi:hypothetical protein